MILDFSPSPSLFICNTKVFEPGEVHSTRRYFKSVLLLMMDGELKFREDGKIITLHPGEYYIQREGLLQEGVPLKDPPIYFFIEFSGTFSDGQFGLPLHGTFSAAKVVPLLERLEELFLRHHADLFKLNSYMLRVFSELLGGRAIVNEKYNTAYLIRNYIDSNYNTKITLADISKKVGYTEDYIARIFKEQYKITPHRYLTSLRMEHARWTLENTSLSAEQTALTVGYSDFSAFYRCFRKTFGVAPGAIRPEPSTEKSPMV